MLNTEHTPPHSSEIIVFRHCCHQPSKTEQGQAIKRASPEGTSDENYVVVTGQAGKNAKPNALPLGLISSAWTVHPLVYIFALRFQSRTLLLFSTIAIAIALLSSSRRPIFLFCFYKKDIDKE
jgi:hypothetical protein